VAHPIASCAEAEAFFFKYVSANDVGATGSHQAGFYMPRDSWKMFFHEPGERGENRDTWLHVQWDHGTTKSRFVWYGKKTRSEYRLTNGFQFLSPDNVGDLLVLAKKETDYYGFILQSDESIDEFLASFGLSPSDSGTVQFRRPSDDASLEEVIHPWARTFGGEFPSGEMLSSKAREFVRPLLAPPKSEIPVTAQSKGLDLDSLLLQWLDYEFRIFRIIEREKYGSLLARPFESVEDLIQISHTILNRRKSRAGNSLENHLRAIFQFLGIRFSFQETTEGSRRPDFTFPGKYYYDNPAFPSSALRFLGVKTTCKDRWRQILNEADRIPRKHLFTLQQGVSSTQLSEMWDCGVILVVPQKHKPFFPPAFQSKIMSLREFLDDLPEIPEGAEMLSKEYKLF
jgi:type II restriction enzyme